VEVAQKEPYKGEKKWFTGFLRKHPMTGDVLPRLGTANLVMTTAGRNIIPTFNFQRGHHADSVKISGQRMAEEHLVKQSGCISCPIQCGRWVKFDDGHEGKGPEFETIGLMGNNLGVFDLQAVYRLGEMCDDLGLDSISCGGTLAAATELTEKGLLESDLAWGDVAAYERMLVALSHREGVGDRIAEGSQRLAASCGAPELAMTAKGLELPAYDPRGCWGQGLEYATTNRGGCHVQGSTMYLEATGAVTVDPHSTKSKPELVILQQNMAAGISSLVMCMFSMYAMIPPMVFRWDPQGAAYRAMTWTLLHSGPILRLSDRFRANLPLLWYEKFLSQVSGERWTMGRFVTLGERVFTMERLYNLREGLTAADDDLPRRIKEEPTFPGMTGGVPLGAMLPRYYRLRGWDAEGRPSARTLARLGIDSTARGHDDYQAAA